MKGKRPSLIAISVLVLGSCSGCNSGSSGGTPPVSPPPVSPPPASTTIAGTAAAGWPISGMVYAKDSNGNAFGPVNVAPSGSYSVDVTNGTAPFVLEVSGTIGLKSIFVHSVAFSGDLGANVNITPLTELALVNAGAATSTLYSQCTSSTCPIPSQANLTAAEASVQSELAAAFTAFSVPSADFRTTPFTTGAVSGQSPIDVLLDAIGFVPNATPNSFNVAANIPMSNIAAGTLLGVLPPPAFSPSGAPTTGSPVAFNPALSASVVAAATYGPKGVKAVGSNMRVALSWSPVAGASAYNIYRATTPNVSVNQGTEIAGVSSPYQDSGLTNGTTYYYIAATVVSGQSYPSTVVSATPSAGPPVVAINPNNLTISLPANLPQSFVINNQGPTDSSMSFLVADDGPLGGFLDVQNGLGVLPGGTSATVSVSVLPAFAGDTGPSLVGATLVLSVYTPQASNSVKTGVAVNIDQAFPLNVSITGSTDNVTNVQVCAGPVEGNSFCGPNGGFAVGSMGVIQVPGTSGASYAVTVPANQNAAAFCSVTSGGTGELGTSMPTAVVNCI